VAALVRICNLGTFSLDLDEVLTMTRAVLPFPEMIAACAADADNVPLYLVITRCSLRLGLLEPWLRSCAAAGRRQTAPPAIRPTAWSPVTRRPL